MYLYRISLTHTHPIIYINNMQLTLFSCLRHNTKAEHVISPPRLKALKQQSNKRKKWQLKLITTNQALCGTQCMVIGTVLEKFETAIHLGFCMYIYVCVELYGVCVFQIYIEWFTLKAKWLLAKALISGRFVVHRFGDAK